jgi:heme exporter protein A
VGAARATVVLVSVLVEAVGVSKFYGATRALRDASLVIAPGEVIGFSGPNGSGKSTLLRVLSTLTQPSRGRVSFPGTGSRIAEVRRDIGFVSHEAMAYGDLTVLENIALAAQLLGARAESRVASLVERMGLGPLEGRALRACSRGQRQRVAIARAFVGAPRLLLLDEPTTGLDDAGVACLQDMLREEKARGTSVAVVLHDRAWASELITRDLLFDRGRVSEAG